MDEESVDALVGLVDRRRELLGAVVEQPREKPALVETLDVSRTTIDRGLRRLREAGLAVRTDDGFAATAGGRLLLRSVRRHRADVAAAGDARDVLAALPADLDLPCVLMRDATVHEAAPPAPNRALAPLRDLLGRADRAAVLSASVADERSVHLFRERACEGLALEMVFSETVLSYLVAEHRDALAAYLSAGPVYSVSDLPFSLVLAETPTGRECQVVLFGTTGEFVGLVVADTPGAVAWAERTVERHRGRADRIGDGTVTGPDAEAETGSVLDGERVSGPGSGGAHEGTGTGPGEARTD
jgi:predicted transcriptional regulator